MSEKSLKEPLAGAEGESNSIHFIRHSKAEYGTYRAIKSSGNPQSGMDPEHQIIPDLTEEGIALAEKKAEELLSRLDPTKDILFFASSNEARVLETANIYRKVAHGMGFEIIKPQKSGLKLAEKIGEGEIRVVHNLSLNSKNLLLQTLFNPDYQNKTVNWDALDLETLKKCKEVRALIREHDYGSFGANFFHYSEKVQALFPELKSAKDMFERQFHNLLELAKFGLKKAHLAEQGKRVKILAFGHENYIAYALEHYFQDHDIKNCETIDVNVGTAGIDLVRRGVAKRITTEK